MGSSPLAGFSPPRVFKRGFCPPPPPRICNSGFCPSGLPPRRGGGPGGFHPLSLRLPLSKGRTAPMHLRMHWCLKKLPAVFLYVFGSGEKAHFTDFFTISARSAEKSFWALCSQKMLSAAFFTISARSAEKNILDPFSPARSAEKDFGRFFIFFYVFYSFCGFVQLHF